MSIAQLKLRTAILYNRAQLECSKHNREFKPRMIPEYARPAVLDYTELLRKAPQKLSRALGEVDYSTVPLQLQADIVEIELCASRFTPFFYAAKAVLIRSENLFHAAAKVETNHEASLARAAAKELLPQLVYDLDGLLCSGDGCPSESLVNNLGRFTSLLRKLQLPEKDSVSYRGFVEGYEHEELQLEVALLTAVL